MLWKLKFYPINVAITIMCSLKVIVYTHCNLNSMCFLHNSPFPYHFLSRCPKATKAIEIPFSKSPYPRSPFPVVLNGTGKAIFSYTVRAVRLSTMIRSLVSVMKLDLDILYVLFVKGTHFSTQCVPKVLCEVWS